MANSHSDTAAWQQLPRAAAPPWSGEPSHEDTGNEQDRHRELTLRCATGHRPAHPVRLVSHSRRGSERRAQSTRVPCKAKQFFFLLQ